MQYFRLISIIAMTLSTLRDLFQLTEEDIWSTDTYICEFMCNQRHMNEELLSVLLNCIVNNFDNIIDIIIMILIIKLLLRNVYKPNLFPQLCLVSSVMFTFLLMCLVSSVVLSFFCCVYFFLLCLVSCIANYYDS